MLYILQQDDHSFKNLKVAEIRKGDFMTMQPEPQAQKNLMLGSMVSYQHPEILNNFWKMDPPFLFCTRLENYKAGPGKD